MHPQVLKSNNGSGPTAPPTEPDLNVKFEHVLFHLLGGYMMEFDVSIFSNSPGSDLSNGVGPVKSYTRWKIYGGTKLALERPFW